MAKKKKEEIHKMRNPDFVKLYSTNVAVEESDVDVRVYTYNEVLDFEDNERVAIADGVLILHREAAILLHEQLDEVMKKWAKEGKNLEVGKSRREILRSIK